MVKEQTRCPCFCLMKRLWSGDSNEGSFEELLEVAPHTISTDSVDMLLIEARVFMSGEGY